MKAIEAHVPLMYRKQSCLRHVAGQAAWALSCGLGERMPEAAVC